MNGTPLPLDGHGGVVPGDKGGGARGPPPVVTVGSERQLVYATGLIAARWPEITAELERLSGMDRELARLALGARVEAVWWIARKGWTAKGLVQAVRDNWA